MQINRDVPSPYCVQIEPSEGCNIGCHFCALQVIRDNGADSNLGINGKNSAPYRFMTLETHERIVSEISRLSWNPRIEYAMHGEPTMNKSLADMIAAARKHNPKAYIMVTSNGGGLQKDAYKRVEALFRAGLNTLALDDYKHADGLVRRIKEQLAEYEDLASWYVYHYPGDPEGNPHHRHNKQKLVYLNDIKDNTTGNHQLTNQGGSVFLPTKEPLAQRCSKPFRELSIRWDGSTAICCDDWPGRYKIGNVNDTPLDEIWYHPRFEAARRRLYAGSRAFGPSAPCTGCDVRTYRNGLLPDKLGKSEMLPEDDESKAAIREALRGRVFSIKLGKGD